MWRIAALFLAVALLVLVVSLDVATKIWQELVILSGITAGLLTFILTAFFIEKWMNQREHQNWYPVTRLALTDLLHTVCDDQKSDIRRGIFVVRTLPIPGDFDRSQLEVLLAAIVEERDRLTDALARWAGFLAASADVQYLMIHIANLAEQLDEMRDRVLEVESEPSQARFAGLTAQVELYDSAMFSVIEELQQQLDEVQPASA